MIWHEKRANNNGFTVEWYGAYKGTNGNDFK